MLLDYSDCKRLICEEVSNLLQTEKSLKLVRDLEILLAGLQLMCLSLVISSF